MDDSHETIDHHVVRAAAAGDSLAWERIVHEYVPRLIGFCRSKGLSPENAEEIAQSTMVRVVAHLGAYAERGRFEPWLFRIALNLIVDEGRRARRHATPTDPEQLIAFAGGDSSVHEGSIREEVDEARLDRALDALTDAERTVLDLRYGGGLGFRAIADVLDEPMGTLLARHHRALGKLRDHLGLPEKGEES
ncbi:MAG: RNA polymerase sigma factor [Planctomycetota bacterium]|nr:RNA polymerase sigma factor [Planctomycetota bacterium]